MSLLTEIQQSLLREDEDIDLEAVMLKLQFLASHLGSDVLEEWVRHETIGYPANVPVPDYRELDVTYRGTFVLPPNVMKNIPIPSSLIEELADKEWLKAKIRQGVAALDELAHASRESRTAPSINQPDLLPVLQGTVYEGYACTSVAAHLSLSAPVEIRSSVRSRVLDLTTELGKKIPAAADITIEARPTVPKEGAAAATQVFNQIIHGNFTQISSSGPGAQFFLGVEIKAGDPDSLAKALIKGGVPEADAKELTNIASTKGIERAIAWLQDKVGKFANNVSVAVITDLLTKSLGG